MLSDDPKIRETILRDLAWRSTPINMARFLTAGHPNPLRRLQKPKHLALLSSRFVDAAVGRRLRQIINLPPQHAKSWHTSWWSPIWYLDWFPHKRIILASYGADFAASWGRRVRDTILFYSDVLRVKLRDNVTSSTEWETTEGGGMVTGGVGTGLAGRPADLLIIDDPHKDAADAQSPVHRKRAWEWWQSVAEPRLQADAPVIIPSTRWHEEDLPGQLMNTTDSGDWEVVRLPALAEENDMLGRSVGEALWPEKYNADLLERRKRNMHIYWWNTIYQQRPPELASGSLYVDFATDRNVKPWVKLDVTQPVHLRIDFNRNPGMHAVVGQYFHRFATKSPDVASEDVFTSYRVIHEPRMNIEQMIAVFYKELWLPLFGTNRHSWPMIEVFGDATGRTSQMGDGKTYWEIVAKWLSHFSLKHRFRLKKTNPGKIDRANAVNESLKDPDGQAHYVIHPDCSILTVELKNVKLETIDEGHATAADGYCIEYLRPARSAKSRPSKLLRVGMVNS